MKGKAIVKNGRYYAVLYMKDSNGKRKPKWVSLKLPEKGNKRKAEEMLAQLLKQYEGLENADALTTLFSTYLIEWCQKKKGDVAVTTWDEYMRMVEQYIKPYFDQKGITLANLNAGDLEDFYLYEQTQNHLSPNTVIKHHAIIRSTLQWAFKHKYITENVADLAKRPKKKKPKLDKPYSVSEVNELLTAVSKETVYAPVVLGAVLGLRRSEALGLRWSAIDFDKGTIAIETTVVRQKDGDKLVTAVRDDTTKTEESTRCLPLCDYTRAVFAELLKRREYNKRICGDSYNTAYDDFVCVNAMGDLIQPDYVTAAFSKALKKYGLRHIRFHDLRHSCAQILHNLGYSIKDLQTWLGHSDFRFTANTYLHDDDDAHMIMAEGYSAQLTASLPFPDGAKHASVRKTLEVPAMQNEQTA